jgi:hypothetical protein
MRTSPRTRLATAAALFTAAALMLSLLHGAVPHHSGQTSCVACQVLSAPAIVPPEEPGDVVLQAVNLEAGRGDDALPDRRAPRLRPLRAPPPRPAV